MAGNAFSNKKEKETIKHIFVIIGLFEIELNIVEEACQEL